MRLKIKRKLKWIWLVECVFDTTSGSDDRGKIWKIIKNKITTTVFRKMRIYRTMIQPTLLYATLIYTDEILNITKKLEEDLRIMEKNNENHTRTKETKEQWVPEYRNKTNHELTRNGDEIVKNIKKRRPNGWGTYLELDQVSNI